MLFVTSSSRPEAGGGEDGEDTAPLPTPDKEPKPKLLQGINANTNLGDKDIEEIKVKYQTLPHAEDGKLEFDQIKSHLPADLNPAQEQYMKKVYEMSISGGNFKEEDFVSVYSLSKKISTLNGTPLEAFNTLDETKLEGIIAKFGELFETVDRQQTGRITITSLREILNNALESDAMTSILDIIIPVIDPENEGSVGKLDYLAFVPYFLSLVP
ncbi:hypothetical protein LSH36_9g14034 [Paralvinella palmiformis]|uniref:EF-hand domain-containing protein n=1 Tax=Paralvinella palmiformis TaxID=53620 RepID=A0AAD9KE74_9ANNE|nr:hypothetical protein LSH36_9g14034 [Paralvinella palmiformis]